MSLFWLCILGPRRGDVRVRFRMELLGTRYFIYPPECQCRSRAYTETFDADGRCYVDIANIDTIKTRIVSFARLVVLMG